jgi:2-methylaconitate cis-trans-isomerase PrpF
MIQRKFPAVFMRGGTSKAIMFHARDLPAERAEWDAIFLSTMGSPDPQGRQLDGMGGGISSLSKVCVIAPSQRADADIDYTFAQVQVRQARVDYGANCGNMSSAVGPFALDEGLVAATDGDARVRIFNTNTKKIIHSTFSVQGGRAAVEGTLAIPGVAGTGAPIRLDFVDPGGATTGRLLPSGNASDELDIPGFGRIEVSMVDAANACVFVAADALGLKGIEMPDELERSLQSACTPPWRWA